MVDSVSVRGGHNFTSYEDAVRNAILLDGDADTLASITGGIAEGWVELASPKLCSGCILEFP